MAITCKPDFTSAYSTKNLVWLLQNENLYNLYVKLFSINYMNFYQFSISHNSYNFYAL